MYMGALEPDPWAVHCPTPQNRFLTGADQFYSCFQLEDKPEPEVERHTGLTAQQ